MGELLCGLRKYLHPLPRWGQGPLAVLLAAALTVGCGGGGDSAPTGAAAEAAEAAHESVASVGRGWASAPPGVSVQALIPAGVRRISSSLFEFDFKLVLRNSGPALETVVVKLAPPGGGVQVIDGTVNAGNLAANSYAVPADTITVRKRLLPLFLLSPHTWVITSGPPVITGVAAVGAALANGEVTITDSLGATVCVESPVITTGTGAYTCTVQPERTAPFLVVVNDPFKAYPPLVSIVPTAPASGTTLVANATPLTTAIVGRLAPDGNALSVVANPALIDLVALSNITTNVLAQIAPVLSALGTPAGYDPFTTQIVAGTVAQGGNTADQVIEALRFTTVNGVSTVSTVDNTDGGVPLAGATTTTPPPLPQPSPELLTFSDALRQLTASLTACYAQPVAARVLATDQTLTPAQGGSEVTALGGECQNLPHPAYKNNGFRYGQRHYGLLRDEAMVGATFSPAEVMLFRDDATAADADVALVNLRFVDANGVAANMVELLRKLPGSATATHPGTWWLHGNQQEVDSALRAFIRRNEQLAPSPGTAPFTNASASRYETGFEIFINKDGPGSTGLRAARVTGPGLPPAGLVYTRPVTTIASNQTWLNLRRKDGLTDPASATLAGDVGNIFRIQRTQGLTGTAPLPVQNNPNQGNSNNTAFMNWSHPLDYGAAVGTPSTGYIDFAALKANTEYSFEYFYDGETEPRYTYTKTMLTPIVPATLAVNLRWHTLTPAALAYLDPTSAQAGALSTAALSWVADPFAETVASAGFYTFGGGQTVSDATIRVVRGATTATANAPAGTFPALTNDGASGRTIQLRHRMLDGSYKDATWRFN
jgi:hypothetical protein